MKTIWYSISTFCLLLLLLGACSKEEVRPAAPNSSGGQTTIDSTAAVDSTAIIEAREQKAASDYAVAQSLLNEVVTLPFRMAYQNPELFGAVGSTKAQTRSGCPMDTILIDQGNGDTLLLDFGNGCTLPNGSMVAGQMMLISFGDFITNANQFVWFDTITINGYDIIHIPGTGSSGLKFVNVEGLGYLFQGFLPNNTFFEIRSPNGDVTTIVPLYSSDIWTKIRIVDNDPPLVLNYNDFLDACFEIELNQLTVSTFRPDGSTDIYFVRKFFDGNGLDEVIYKPGCRWFSDGRLVFTGTIEQTLDFGVDLDPHTNLPIDGTTCDGVVKITTPSGGCTVVVCP
ncbi:MAG: hypothetical protein AAF990_27365 [Bacteroidota bacterium]